MTTYFLITLVTSVLSYLSVKLKGAEKDMASYLLLGGAVLIFCHFAGMRDVSVGTDTGQYGIISFYAARRPLAEFYFDGQFASWAPLVKLVSWVTANVFRSSYFYFFVYELLTVIPMMYSIRKISYDWSWIGVALFGLLYYPMSFNIMRQSIAMSFVLLSFIFLYQHNYIRYVLLVLISIGFHTSGIIGLVLFPFALFSRSKRLAGDLKLTIIMLFSVVFVLTAPQILSLVTSMTGLYENYITGSAVTSGGGRRTFAYTVGITILVGFIGWVLIRKKVISIDSEIQLLYLIVVFGSLSLALSLYSMWLYRLGLYFIYFCTLLAPLSVGQIAGRTERFFFVAVLLALCAFWSWDYYYLQLSNEVVPYLTMRPVLI